MIGFGPNPSFPMSTLYLFGNSSAMIAYKNNLTPELEQGAIYIQLPGKDTGSIHFGANDNNVYATSRGGRIILQMSGSDIWLFCFRGDCGWSIDSVTTNVPANSKMAFHLNTAVLDATPTNMSYDDEWSWNLKCNYCILDILPTPTLGPTAKPVSDASTPCIKVCDKRIISYTIPCS